MKRAGQPCAAADVCPACARASVRCGYIYKDQAGKRRPLTARRPGLFISMAYRAAAVPPTCGSCML